MAEAATSVLTTSAYTRGALYGLAAVSIWAGNIVVAGVGLRSSLTPWDISAIRFGTAGLLLLPYLLRQGLAFERLGWIGLAALVLGGAPTVLLANCGLQFAPAAHAGALFPGVMPLMVVILAAAVLKEVPTPQQGVGLAAHSDRRHRHRLGHGRHHRHHPEYRPPDVSRICVGLGLLHGRPASRPSRRPARCGHFRCRFGAALLAPLCLRSRGQPVRGLA